MSARILLVEDDAALSSWVVETLQKRGFLVQAVAGGDAARGALEADDFDVVVTVVVVAIEVVLVVDTVVVVEGFSVVVVTWQTCAVQVLLQTNTPLAVGPTTPADLMSDEPELPMEYFGVPTFQNVMIPSLIR